MINYGLSSDTWDDREIAALNRVIKSGRYTMGPEVKEYERQFANFFGTKHAVMTNSGSSANLIMLSALKLHPKFDTNVNGAKPNIIVPAVSWSTTYFPVHQNGFDLKFVDVNPFTYNLDVQTVERNIDSNTVGVFAVNLLGNACPLEDLKDLCNKHDLVLLEDNCESLGAKLNNKQCATFGKMGTFSFFFSHHLQTMEGGMVVTDDDDLYEYLLPLRAHGWIRDLPEQNSLLNKTGDDFEDSFKFVLPGYTVRPLEMSGAVGQTQLQKWPKMLEMRRKNADVAQRYLNSPHMHLQTEIGVSSWFGFGLTCIGALEGRRKKVITALQDQGVECRPIVAGNFMRNPVVEHLDHIKTDCPNADYIHDNGFFIGNDCVDLEDKIKAVSRVIEGVV